MRMSMNANTTERQKPTVQLSGRDGNAHAILGRVRTALLEAGCPKADIDRYTAEATSGDYDHLLQVTMDWVETE